MAPSPPTPVRMTRWLVNTALSLSTLVGAAVAPLSAQRPSAPAPVHHVFLIVLENQDYDSTFGRASVAPYLADTLPAKGAILRQYYGTGHLSLDNYISMVSGIAPSRLTQLDCARYGEFVQTGVARDGQPIGTGCIYPARVKTIANQLEARHLTWKAYMEDMGNVPTREAASCGHGTPGVLDVTETAGRGDEYAAKHDPFVYFHSVLDTPSCARNVVPLSRLEAALADSSATPNYAFISPNLCHDAHDRPCADGEPGGLTSADVFLRRWVPRITRSAAFRADGLLIITFDEARGTDVRACCHERSGPNVPAAGINGPGGGRIGAVLLSPFIRPGTVSDAPYNHYSMLRSVEDVFGLPHLGYAAQRGLAPFGKDVYTRRPR